MPQMGYDMQEGTIVRWLKDEGAAVQVGEPIAEIETDKAVVEFESYADGVLRMILVSEGSTVPVGQTIAVVAEADEDLPDVPVAPTSDPEPSAEPTPEPVVDQTAEPEASDETQPVAPAPIPAPAVVAGHADGPVRASPVARRLAEERGIDISQITGTGPGGRVVKKDVEAVEPGTLPVPPPQAPPVVERPTVDVAPEPAPATPPRAAPAPEAALSGEKVPLSRMRQQIARVTVRSKREQPHFYIASDIDMTEAMALRRQINQSLESQGVRVSVNDVIVMACVGAIKRYPKFNAFFADDGIQMNERINVGIAIAEEEGLIVPAILDCADKTLSEISQAARDLIERSQSGALHPEEYTGSTFSTSNLGMFDVTSFAAIIHPPQTAVLAVGTVEKRPVVRNDEIVIREMMTATLSADHRVVDGAEGAQFMVEVKSLLENPLSLLV